jgi:hypothetical protein
VEREWDIRNTLQRIKVIVPKLVGFEEKGKLRNEGSSQILVQKFIPKSSYEASKTSLYVDTARTLADGYGDFNGDGLEDLLLAYVSGIEGTTPIQMFLQNSKDRLVKDNSLLPKPTPGTVHARKSVPDAFIADHGFDQPPFPVTQPLLLLSKGGKLEVKKIPGVPIGFHHGATAADIHNDGIPHIFVTDSTNGVFFLGNDGTGNFTMTCQGIPFFRYGYYTTEFIDVDDDGYYDLLVSGHEQDGATTCIYWCDTSGMFE